MPAVHEHIALLRRAGRRSAGVSEALSALAGLDAATGRLALLVASGGLEGVARLEVSEHVRTLSPLAGQEQLRSLRVRFSDPRPEWPCFRRREPSTPVDLSALCSLPGLRSLRITAEAVDPTPIMLLENLELLELVGDPDSRRARVRPRPPRNWLEGHANVLVYRRRLARALARRSPRSAWEEELLARARGLGLLDHRRPAGLSQGERQQLAAVRRLLRSSEGSLRSVHELLLALGPCPILDVLVEGSFVNARGWVVPGPEVHRRVHADRREEAALMLLDASGRLARVTELHLSWGACRSLAPLARASALRTLNISGCRVARLVEAAALPMVEVIVANRVLGAAHAEALGLPPRPSSYRYDYGDASFVSHGVDPDRGRFSLEDLRSRVAALQGA